MAKYPLLFTKTAFFGRRPSRAHPTQVRNGTLTLADLGGGPIGITCHHVLASYQKLRSELGDVIFQLGHVELDPLAQLIDWNERLDLAVIRFTQAQIDAITSEGEIGSCLYRPKSWPAPPVKEGQFLAFGGFPGVLKTTVAFDELEFNSWSSGGSEISSVTEHRIVSVFDRSNWIRSFGSQTNLDLTALGGMSGGPAFIDRGLYWDLAGIISDYHENYDAVFFATANSIREDGTLVQSAV